MGALYRGSQGCGRLVALSDSFECFRLDGYADAGRCG